MLVNYIKQKQAIRFFFPFIRRFRITLSGALSLVGALPSAFLGLILPLRTVDLKYKSYYRAIGHICVEIDSFIKERILLEGRVSKRYILLAPKHWIINQHLIDAYWSKFFVLTVRSPFLYKICSVILPRYNIDKYCRDELAAARVFQINNRWESRHPLLKLSNDDLAFGSDVCRKWGMAKNDWFVCFHAREPGFTHSPEHRLRNVNIETYFDAMKYVVSQGGWCVRVGDPTMKPLPHGMDRVVDYASGPDRSDRMDLFLMSQCRFLIGCPSGLNALSICFGVPVGVSNICPYFAMPLAHNCVGIFKKLVDKGQNHTIKISEVFTSSTLSALVFQRDFDAMGIEIIDNTSEEILELTKEMLERSQGRFVPNSDDLELQQRLKRLFLPNHYCYETPAWVSREYLRRHF